MNRIYLDHTATTPVDPRVVEAMTPYFSETFGNASSVHWYGRQAKTALEQARQTIAQAIGAEPGEVFFTGGGTESNNLAIRGVASAAMKLRRNHLITSRAEHHAVLEPCEFLATQGIDVSFLPVGESGAVSLSHLEAALRDTTCLVTIMHGNNEVGTLSPVKEIARIAHQHHATVHTDAVQTVGKVPVNTNDLDVDVMTFSAHKLYGPKGIGALYIRRGTGVDPLILGGGQERGRRPGTESVALAVGFAKAVELAVAGMEVESARLKSLRDALEFQIKNEFPAVIVNGETAGRLPHILNISFDSSKLALEGEMLLMNMDLKGIAVSSGSACTSGSVQPSHVLLAMGRDDKTAKATLRFAFGRGNAESDIGEVVRSLHEVLDRTKN